MEWWKIQSIKNVWRIKKNWEEQENIIFYNVLGRRNDDKRFFYLIQKTIVKGLVT